MTHANKKNNSTSKTLILVALFSAILAAAKFIGFLYSGSLIVLASFFDSLSDAASSFINNFIYKKSLARPDKEHPFGHGGFEVIGALIQGLLIAFFSANIFVESLRKLMSGSFRSIEHESLPFAIGVMLFSAAGGLLIHFFLSAQANGMKKRRERSLVLLADKAHYSGDVFANLASALGIFIVYITQLQYLDPLMGCLAAIFLGAVAVPLLKKTYKDIVHNEAPEELQQVIVNIVMSVDSRIKGIHLLRSREFGPFLFVDFHMKLADNLHLKDAHKIGEDVELAIKKVFLTADVFIHLDPESEPDQKFWNPSYTLPQ
jgi:cation diffusion facilitator family transporter